MEPARVAATLRDACLLELRALKPGNVHRYAAGHGMTLADFERSAVIVERVFAKPEQSVGALILDAVDETVRAVGCNTNLGIVLLAAPLAVAALREEPPGLRDRLKSILRALTVEDADLAYQAIRLAKPAGLGKSARHDVRDEPQVTLLEAMTSAAERDRIAGQYATDFGEIFDFALPRLRAAEARGRAPEWAAASLYLDVLSHFPDSHVRRKHGPAKAERVMQDAVPLAAALRDAARPEDVKDRLQTLDQALKAEGINPGTSADLTVASLFAAGLEGS